MKDCSWITSKVAEGSANQLYYFKKEFDLKTVKDARVDISAQARYKLYRSTKSYNWYIVKSAISCIDIECRPTVKTDKY